MKHGYQEKGFATNRNGGGSFLGKKWNILKKLLQCQIVHIAYTEESCRKAR